MTPAISSNDAASIDRFNAETFATARKPSDTLNQNSFIKLLVTQLQNQDPSAPLSNNDFAQQVTSFSTLQSTQSMQTDMSWLRSSSLIGSTVDVMPGSSTNSADMVSGVVSKVSLVDGVPQIVVNGQTYKMSEVKNVRLPDPKVQQTAVQTSATQIPVAHNNVS
jgi:flagellar basal-body rod modification protein FlgD